MLLLWRLKKPNIPCLLLIGVKALELDDEIADHVSHLVESLVCTFLSAASENWEMFCCAAAP